MRRDRASARRLPAGAARRQQPAGGTTEPAAGRRSGLGPAAGSVARARCAAGGKARPLLALLLLAGCVGPPETTGAGIPEAEAAERPLPPPALPGRVAALPPRIALPMAPAAAQPPAEPAPIVGPAAEEPTVPAAAALVPPSVAQAPPAPAPRADPALAGVAGPAAGREGPLVQLVAAGSEAEARAYWAGFVQRLPDLAEGAIPRILPFERPGQPTVWRLRLGGFANAEAAQAWCERLRARGSGCWVAR